ncbi:MAG: fibronectin type III domain-containing protein, partial [Luteibaculaceae bacterium]
MKKNLFFSVVTGLMLLFSYSGWTQTTVTGTNATAIGAPYAVTVNNTMNSACPYTITVNVPEGSTILSTNINYSITAGNGAFMSEQFSFVRVTNSGGGVTAVQNGAGFTGGTFTYNIENTPIANGLTGDISFELHLFRNWPSTEVACENSYQNIPVGSYTVSITYVEAGVCPAPFNLDVANIQETTANLSWVLPLENFEVSVGPLGHTPGEAPATVTPVTGNTLAITGLEPAESYEVFVRTLCDAGATSAWSQGATFTTLCFELDPVELPGNFVDGFEECLKWNIVNGTAVNQWHFGTAVAQSGNRSMYISSDGGDNNTYNGTTPSIVHFYQDFEIEAGFTEIFLSFNWRNLGDFGNDWIRAYLAPTTFTPTAGVIPTGAGVTQITPNLRGQASWQTFEIQAPQSLAGTTARLIFTWNNDAFTATQPPAAIDNVSISVAPQPTKDIQALQTLFPAALCLNTTAPVGVKVFNYGSDDLNFAVNTLTATVNVTGAITETYTLTVNEGTLASGEELDIIVAQMPVTTAGTYNATASVSMSGDEIPQNNGPTAQLTALAFPILELPQSVFFDEYNGGNVSLLNPAWLSAGTFGFTTRSNDVQEAAFGKRTTKHNQFGANANTFIQSPFFEVEDAESVLIFEAALTKWITAGVADPMRPGDRITVELQTCGSSTPIILFEANHTSSTLTNNLQSFTYSLADYVGETLRVIFRSVTVLGSEFPDNIRDNDVHFTDIFVGIPPDCQRPTNLQFTLVPNPTNPDEKCVEFTWDPGSDDQFIFELVWGSPGFNPLTEGNVENIAFEESFVLCGIPVGVPLQAYIRADCGIGGLSEYSAVRNFVIPPPGSNCDDPFVVQSLPFLIENVNTANHGNNFNSDNLTGTACAGSGVYLNGDDWIATYTPTQSGNLRVRMFDIVGTWGGLFVLDNCPTSSPNCLGSATGFDNQDRILQIEATAGQTLFFVISTWAPPPSVTFDFEIVEVPCEEIVINNIVIAPVDLTTATVSFPTFGLNDFTVIYGPVGFDPDVEGTSTNVTTSPAVIDNLVSGTFYDFYVRPNCENGPGVWSAVVPFLTPQVGSSCQTPKVVGALPYLDANVASLEFGNFHNAAQLGTASLCINTFYLNQSEVVYSFTAPTTGAYKFRTFNIVGSSPAMFILNGCPSPTATCLASFGAFAATEHVSTQLLTAGQTVTIIVSTSSTLGINFDFEVTAEPCAAPTNLLASVVAPGIVGFSWNAFDGLDFNVKYGLEGFNVETAGTLLSGVMPGVQIEDLEVGNIYQFYAQRVCEEVTTPWVGPFTLLVPPSGGSCGDPIVVTPPTIGTPTLITNINTADYGNTYSGALLNGTNCTGGTFPGTFYLNGDDAVFSLTMPVDAEVEIRMQNIQTTWSSLYVMQNCPDNGPICLGAVGNSATTDRVVTAELLEGQEYFILLSSWPLPQNAIADLQVSMLGITTSINEQIAGNGMFKVFPNPNNGAFSIIIAENAPNAHVEVFDLQGKLVYNKKVNIVANENFRVDLGNVSTGMYNIRVTTPNSVEFSRVMV